MLNYDLLKNYYLKTVKIKNIIKSHEKQKNQDENIYKDIKDIYLGSTFDFKDIDSNSTYTDMDYLKQLFRNPNINIEKYYLHTYSIFPITTNKLQTKFLLLFCKNILKKDNTIKCLYCYEKKYSATIFMSGNRYASIKNVKKWLKSKIRKINFKRYIHYKNIKIGSCNFKEKLEHYFSFLNFDDMQKKINSYDYNVFKSELYSKYIKNDVDYYLQNKEMNREFKKYVKEVHKSETIYEFKNETKLFSKIQNPNVFFFES